MANQTPATVKTAPLIVNPYPKGTCDWTTHVYELGGQIISIRLPGTGISAEICAGLGRYRNCLGLLLVTEPSNVFVSQYEAVYSVCAPEDEWDFWTGFEVAASRLLHPHIFYDLLIEELRPLVEAALRNKYSKWHSGDLLEQLTAPPGSGLGLFKYTPPTTTSIIPAELKTTVIDSPEMYNKPHLSEWDGGAYCTSLWTDVSFTEESCAGGAWGRTRKEAFGRWLHKTHTMPEFRKRHWQGYYAAFPQDRKGGPR